jgi:hypothetical protein
LLVDFKDSSLLLTQIPFMDLQLWIGGNYWFSVFF